MIIFTEFSDAQLRDNLVVVVFNFDDFVDGALESAELWEPNPTAGPVENKTSNAAICATALISPRSGPAVRAALQSSPPGYDLSRA